MRYSNRRNGIETLSSSRASASSFHIGTIQCDFFGTPDDCSRGISSDSFHFVTNTVEKRIDRDVFVEKFAFIALCRCNHAPLKRFTTYLSTISLPGTLRSAEKKIAAITA